jgi:hypothetical protein
MTDSEWSEYAAAAEHFGVEQDELPYYREAFEQLAAMGLARGGDVLLGELVAAHLAYQHGQLQPEVAKRLEIRKIVFVEHVGAGQVLDQHEALASFTPEQIH